MKKIKIQQIGKFFEEEHEALIRFAVFTLDSRIKQVSPVDTGRFRNPLPYAEAVCFGTNTPPSWNNTFQSRDSNRSAGWPLKEVEFVARKVRKAQSKN